MTDIELLKSAIMDIDHLTLSGALNWQKAENAIKKIYAVVQTLEDAKKQQEQDQADALEIARQKRKEQLENAAANGEKVIGGETIRVNADGTQEVLIP